MSIFKGNFSIVYLNYNVGGSKKRVIPVYAVYLYNNFHCVWRSL